MKGRRMMALAAIALSCALSVSACSRETVGGGTGETAKETQSSRDAESSMTLGETADFLIETASKYGNLIERSTLLKELEDREGDQATGMDMLVLVSRAFGNLPEPEEGRKEKGEVSLDEVPEWALADVENLKRVGVLKSSDLENAQEPATKEAVEQMVERVMNLYGN